MKPIETTTLLKSFARGSQKEKVKTSSRNAVIYTRVSTREQAITNQSLETQRKYCLEYANKQGLNVLGFFGGTYESAKTDERNEFNRMIRFVKNQNEQVSTILVYSLDRFSRTGDNAIFISSELKKCGISVFSVTQPIDVSTHAGVLQQNIQFIFSKYDNDLRKEKCVTGMKEKLLRGEWIGHVPIGYSYDRNHGDNTQRIVLNENAKFIKKAFILKAEQGLPNIEIAAKLSSLGCRLSEKNVTRVLQNPFYCGYISQKLLDGVIVRGKHEALISEDLFLLANNIVAKNSFGYKHELKNNNTPLKAFIICSACATPLTGYMVKKKGLYYYKCNKKGCKCNRSAVRMNEKFAVFLKSFELSESFFGPMREGLLETYESLAYQDKEATKLLTHQLTDVEKKIDTVEERFALGEISRNVYEKMIEKFEGEKMILIRSLNQADFKLSNPIKYIDFALKICSNLSNLWVSANYDGRRKMQNILFPEGIVYDREIDDYRTKKINVLLSLTESLSKTYKKKEGEKPERLFNFSPSVVPTGIEPVLPE